MKSKLKGNISLTTVLITTTLILLGALTVLLSSTDLSLATKTANIKMLNELRAHSCLEEGLNRLKKDTLYIGTVTITFADGNCSAIVVNDPINSNLKNFTISSIMKSHNYDIDKVVDVSVDPFVIID